MNSICIPVYDRPDYLEKCLNGILQYCESPYEVVCCMDAPKDPKIFEVLDRFQKEVWPTNMKIVKNEQNMDLCYTINRAMENATGDYLIHLEGDIVVPTKGWNRIFENFLAIHPEVGIVTPITSLRQDTIVRRDYREGQWALGGLSCIPKHIFDMGLGWDVDLKHQRECDQCLRIRMSGYRLAGIESVPGFIHYGENDFVETDARKALMNTGVHNFLKKWNKRFMGFGCYKDVPFMSWDDFPINVFFRNQAMSGDGLNKNPQPYGMPQGPNSNLRGSDAWWELIYITRPKNRNREEELCKLIKENYVFKDGEPLEERMKGRSYEGLCKGKELSVNWVYLSDIELDKLKKSGIKFGR